MAGLVEAFHVRVRSFFLSFERAIAIGVIRYFGLSVVRPSDHILAQVFRLTIMAAPLVADASVGLARSLKSPLGFIERLKQSLALLRRGNSGHRVIAVAAGCDEKPKHHRHRYSPSAVIGARRAVSTVPRQFGFSMMMMMMVAGDHGGFGVGHRVAGTPCRRLALLGR